MADPARPIEYLSQSRPVNMGDDWFDIANLDHFWMRRRFDVFTQLVPQASGDRWAEVGCGHGVVQRQCEEEFDIGVDGIDLNEYALQRNIARRGRLLCYDVFDRSSSMAQQYDRVVLFDVIEHLDDDAAILDAVAAMLKPNGSIVINVPAFESLRSQYDVAAGHVRRYDIQMLREVLQRVGLRVDHWTYWGLTMVPLLWLRKAMLNLRKEENVIARGFAVNRRWLNEALYHWSGLQWTPQHFHGTSLMAHVLPATDPS